MHSSPPEKHDGAPSRTPGAAGWLAPRPPSRLLARATRRIAGWRPLPVATITVTVGLALHELLYHLAGGDDYPLEVAFAGAQVFALSHGGLDALAVGILVLSVLLILDGARDHTRTR